VLLREYKWEPSFIARAAFSAIRAAADAAHHYRPEGNGPQGLAKQLESRLFDEGRVAYFLGIGNVLYGVDADIARDRENRAEHIVAWRRSPI
jgi:bifunctional enzyme CysN/CysC